MMQPMMHEAAKHAPQMMGDMMKPMMMALEAIARLTSDSLMAPTPL